MSRHLHAVRDPDAPTAGREGAPADVSSAALDETARWPLTALLGVSLAGLFWWGLFQVLAAIKLHAPGFLAGCPWLTYGRVQPVAWNLLVYGFGIPVGLMVATWITSRLSRTALVGGALIFLGSAVWGGGVLLGVLAIFSGHSTGVEGLEMPGFTVPVLFVGYLLMASPLLMTFFTRRATEVYVSQWYILSAVVVFPWLYLAGALQAVVYPGRGVLPASIASWFVHGVLVCWFGGLALAVALYFLPKLTGRPLPSRNLAVFGFWMLVFFGPLGGMVRRLDGPFPAWMSSLGVASCSLVLVAGYALLVNLAILLRGLGATVRAGTVTAFMAFSAGSFLLWTLLVPLSGFEFLHARTGYTLFAAGLDWLVLWGAFGTAMLGALYYIVPRLLGEDWIRPGWVRLHFGLAVGAVTLLVLSSLLGGWVQGGAINDPSLEYVRVAKRYIPFAATGTLAFLVLWGGALLLVIQLKWMLLRRWLGHCLPKLRGWCAPVDSEVRA
ncbi:MAG: cbb3-type cytochrome c oxidase subunit I [Verrucomicrobiales bacterium]|nr:cbb3-type cytochrome c oxidase subunit I [Verrucomicrobiales bacterium]